MCKILYQRDMENPCTYVNTEDLFNCKCGLFIYAECVYAITVAVWVNFTSFQVLSLTLFLSARFGALIFFTIKAMMNMRYNNEILILLQDEMFECACLR